MIDVNAPPYNLKPERPDLDSTGQLQWALNNSGLRAEPVFIKTGRYWFRSNIVFPHNASLKGDGFGQFDPMWSPIEKLQGPTFLPMNQNGEAFIKIIGSNGGIEGIIIAYLNQVKPNDPGVGTSGPKIYPPTIVANMPTKIRRLYIPNAYEAIHALCGRVYIEDCHIGAFKRDILVDNARDVVRITNLVISRFWDWGFADLQAIDFWVLNNGVGVETGRADGFQMQNALIHGRNIGIKHSISRYPEDSDGAVSGQANNVNLDTVKHGIVANATEERVGMTYTNLLLGPYWGEPLGHAVWLQRSLHKNTAPPVINIVGGSIRHQWAKKPDGSDWAFRVDAGELYKTRILGDDIGVRR